MGLGIHDNWSDAPEFLAPGITWQRNDDDTGNMYVAHIGDDVWYVRLNDFPSEPMFTLIVRGIEIIHFNDWPLVWGPRPN